MTTRVPRSCLPAHARISLRDDWITAFSAFANRFNPKWRSQRSHVSNAVVPPAVKLERGTSYQIAMQSPSCRFAGTECGFYAVWSPSRDSACPQRLHKYARSQSPRQWCKGAVRTIMISQFSAESFDLVPLIFWRDAKLYAVRLGEMCW